MIRSQAIRSGLSQTFLRCTAWLVLLLACGATGQASSCADCGGTRKAAIARNSSWTRAAKFQAEMHLWCSWCEGLGVYDKEIREGPCERCGAFPNPTDPQSGLPVAMRDALATQTDYWWKSRPSSRVVFMITPTMTVSCGLAQMELNKTGLKDYYRERMIVAKHCPGTDPKRDRVISRHERAHLHMQRIIDSYESCNAAVGVATSEEDKYYRITVPRVDIFIYDSAGERDAFVAQHGGHGRYLGTEVMTAASTGVDSNADDILWGFIIHNLAHHWCDRIWGGQRERQPAGWLFNGIAHYTEMQLCGEPVNKCDNEFNKGMQWTKSRWRSKIYKLVANGEADLQALLNKNHEAQTFDDHLLSWSLVDFFSTLPKKKTAKLVGELCHDKTMAEALRDSFGWTTNLLEINWVRYVQMNYKNEPKKPDTR